MLWQTLGRPNLSLFQQCGRSQHLSRWKGLPQRYLLKTRLRWYLCPWLYLRRRCLLMLVGWDGCRHGLLAINYWEVTVFNIFVVVALQLIVEESLMILTVELLKCHLNVQSLTGQFLTMADVQSQLHQHLVQMESVFKICCSVSNQKFLLIFSLLCSSFKWNLYSIWFLFIMADILLSFARAKRPITRMKSSLNLGEMKLSRKIFYSFSILLNCVRSW